MMRMLPLALLVCACVESSPEPAPAPHPCTVDAPCPELTPTLVDLATLLGVWSVPPACTLHSDCGPEGVCRDRLCESWACRAVHDCPGPIGGEWLACLDGRDVPYTEPRALYVRGLGCKLRRPK